MTDTMRSQRAWARLAGLMYWVVLGVDLTGLRVHSSLWASSLTLAGSLFTIPLALGLYYAVRPLQSAIAASALSFRLLEAALGSISTLAGFAAFRGRLSGLGWGNGLLQIAAWDDSTRFAALAFTIGSTLFFWLFARSDYIPKILSWWGLFSSLTALAACLTHLMRPTFPAMAWYAWVPMLLAETSTGLWLLFKSIKVTVQTP